jgi:hypothetical protein
VGHGTISSGDFERIEVTVNSGNGAGAEKLEDGWEEIEDGSSDDDGYFEAHVHHLHQHQHHQKDRLGRKDKTTRGRNAEQPLSPRSAAAEKGVVSILHAGDHQMTTGMGEWVIDPRDLQITDRVLGKGFFGEVKKGNKENENDRFLFAFAFFSSPPAHVVVWSGRWRGTPVAVKSIYRELFRSKSEEQLFDKEVSMLRSLHHPHVIQYVLLRNT